MENEKSKENKKKKYQISTDIPIIIIRLYLIIAHRFLRVGCRATGERY